MKPLIVLWQVSLPLGRVLLGLVFAVGLGSLTGAVLSWALLPVPVVLVALWLLRGRLAHVPAADVPVPWARFWSFAAPRGFASCFETTIVWLDVILVSAFKGPAEAGIYAAASRFITTGTLALQATRIAIAPQMAAALAHDDKPRASKLYGGSTVLVVLLSWPLFLTLALFGGTILSLFGDGFSDAAPALAVIAVAMLYYSGVGNVSTVLLMGGRSQWTAMNTLAALTVNVCVNLLLIPHFGATGAAVAWACSILTDTSLSVYQSRQRLGVKGHGRPFLLAAGVAALCFGLGGLLVRALGLGDDLLHLVPALVVVAAVYAGLVLALRGRLGLSSPARAVAA